MDLPCQDLDTDPENLDSNLLEFPLRLAIVVQWERRCTSVELDFYFFLLLFILHCSSSCITPRRFSGFSGCERGFTIEYEIALIITPFFASK